MKEPEFKTVPGIVFARRFSTDKYHVILESSYHIVEITGVIDGSLAVTQNGVTGQADPGDIITNFYGSPLFVDTDKFHIHQTFCFGFDPVEPFDGITLVTHAERGTAQYGFSDPNYVSKLYKKYYEHNVTNQSRKTK